MYIVPKKVPEYRYPLYVEKFKNRTDFAMLMRADYGDDAAAFHISSSCKMHASEITRVINLVALRPNTRYDHFEILECDTHTAVL